MLKLFFFMLFCFTLIFSYSDRNFLSLCFSLIIFVFVFYFIKHTLFLFPLLSLFFRPLPLLCLFILLFLLWHLFSYSTFPRLLTIVEGRTRKTKHFNDTRTYDSVSRESGKEKHQQQQKINSVTPPPAPNLYNLLQIKTNNEVYTCPSHSLV